jgi:guanosine-3',5'-bis(diphosphate) 3'-pyrophosphohydrolase
MTPLIPTLKEILASGNAPFSNDDEKLVADAYAFAEKAHREQKRRSGEPYITHCLAVGLTLREIGMDARTIAAGLLHDVPEDTEVTLTEIEKKFGSEIAYLVDGITKLGKIKLRGTKEELYLENLRKMFLAMARDIRVVIIKLADRLHNMRTLEHVSPGKNRSVSRAKP